MSKNFAQETQQDKKTFEYFDYIVHLFVLHM